MEEGGDVIAKCEVTIWAITDLVAVYPHSAVHTYAIENDVDPAALPVGIPFDGPGIPADAYGKITLLLDCGIVLGIRSFYAEIVRDVELSPAGESRCLPRFDVAFVEIPAEIEIYRLSAGRLPGGLR